MSRSALSLDWPTAHLDTRRLQSGIKGVCLSQRDMQCLLHARRLTGTLAGTETGAFLCDVCAGNLPMHAAAVMTAAPGQRPGMPAVASGTDTAFALLKL